MAGFAAGLQEALIALGAGSSRPVVGEEVEESILVGLKLPAAADDDDVLLAVILADGGNEGEETGALAGAVFQNAKPGSIAENVRVRARGFFGASANLL